MTPISSKDTGPSDQNHPLISNAVLETPGMLVLLLAPDGTIIEINKTFAEILGKSADGIRGTNYWSLLSPESSLGCQASVRQVVEHGRPLSLEHVFVKDCYHVWLLPVRNEAGKVTAIFVVAWNITERKNAEAALKKNSEANERLRHFISILNACTDLDMALVCLVQQAVAIGEMDAAAAYVIEGEEAVISHQVGLDPVFLEKVSRRPITTGYVKCVMENPRELFDVFEQFPEQNQLGKLAGIYHLYSMALIAGHEVFGILNVALRRPEPANPDSLERIRVLATETESLFVRLRSEQQLLSVLSTMAEGFVLHNAEGAIIDCNPRAEAILGLSRDQILGRKSADPRWRAIREDGRPFPGAEHPAMVSLQTGKPCREVIMGLNLPDGTQRWISINSAPMFKTGASSPHAVVASFTDITERRILQDRTKEAQEMEAAGRLAGGMAHEFNNILAALMMNLELIKPSAPGGEPRELVQEMEGLTKRAAGLIKQLLAYSRKSTLNLRPLDLATVISRQCPRIASLLGERIKLEFSSRGELPLVSADKPLIEQMFLNLCLNAQDAMKEGGVLQIHMVQRDFSSGQLSLQGGARPGKFICLSVSDTGTGMDAGTMKNLFQPFFTTKDIGKGTGLGLAAVRGIAQQHDGWVEVESKLGKGSTFRVFLPVAGENHSEPGID